MPDKVETWVHAALLNLGARAGFVTAMLVDRFEEKPAHNPIFNEPCRLTCSQARRVCCCQDRRVRRLRTGRFTLRSIRTRSYSPGLKGRAASCAFDCFIGTTAGRSGHGIETLSKLSATSGSMSRWMHSSGSSAIRPVRPSRLLPQLLPSAASGESFAVRSVRSRPADPPSEQDGYGRVPTSRRRQHGSYRVEGLVGE
jgi:hypothetical protein